MVPLTRKAFFAGVLHPTLSTQTFANDDVGVSHVNGRDSKEVSSAAALMTSEEPDGYIKGCAVVKQEKEAEAEMVLVNLGQGYLVELTRGAAAEMIERRIERSICSAPKASSEGIEEKKIGGGLGSKKKRNTNSKHPAQAKESHGGQLQDGRDKVVKPTQAFFEIREEYDSDGKEIKAERINVANELKNLRKDVKKHNEMPRGVDSDDDPLSDLVGGLDIAGSNNNGNEDSDVEFSNDNIGGPPPSTMSDEQYNALSSRLDELARLEEEAERMKKENMKSSKKLQSHGWGRGFLNSDSKKEKKKKKVEKTTRELPVDSPAATPSPAAAAVADTDEPGLHGHKKTVAFNKTNEVRTIPRIGTTSIKAANLNPCRGAQNIQHGGDSGGVRRPVPFEKDAFTGIVSERPRQQQQRQAEMPVAVDPTIMEQEPKKKKLSRFAQQRQQQRT